MDATDASFFVTGGTIPRNAPSYVERQADDELYQALQQGEFCYVLTARQMGKSSLMVRTAVRLREAAITAAVLDLTGVGQNVTTEQWYLGLLTSLGAQLDLEDELDDFWLDHERLGPLQRWMAALRQVVLLRCPGPIVLFIDEIDAVRSLPFSTDEFFAGMRECYNRRSQDPEFRRLTFCLLGVASPSDLIQDTRTTPFNIGRRIELTDFTDGEAARLATGLELGEPGSPGRPRSAAQALLKRVLRWTGGHPYLTQRLCQALAADPARRTPADVDRLCDELFLSHTARERDDNLVFVRERLLRSEADRAALLDLYRQVREHRRVRDDETNPLCGLLKLAGVARAVQGYLWVRNRIYCRVFDREWVLMNMPDAEVRRQRTAYRQGLLRATAVAAMLLAVVGSLAGLAIYRGSVAQERLVQMDVAAGNRLVDEGDPLGALPWLVEALRLDQGSRERQAVDRLRIGTTLVQCPSLRQMWFHGGEVTSLAFSRDGRRVVTASKDRSARVWDVATGGAVCPPLRHRAAVNRAAFSPDGALVVTASDDGTAQVWNVSGAPAGPPLRHANRVTDAEFSPDGRRVLTASYDATARIWDAVTGRPLLPAMRLSVVVTRAAFSPDGRQVLMVGGEPGEQMNGEVRLFDASTGRPRAVLIQPGAWFAIKQASFSPDSRRVVVAPGQEADVFNAATGRECLPPLRHDAAPTDFFVNTAAFSPDGHSIVTTGSGGGTARLWDARTGKPLLAPLRHGQSEVLTAAYSPDGRRVATVNGSGTVRLWETGTGEPVLVPIPHPAPVTQLAFSPDGRYVATAATDGTARLWELSVPEARARPRGVRPLLVSGSSSSSSTNGRWLLRRCRPNAVQVFAGSGRPVAAPLPHFGPVDAARFSADGRRLCTILPDGSVQLWDVETGRRSLAPLARGSSVTCVDFSPDGRRVVTGSQAGIAQVWDSATGTPVGLPLRHHGSVQHARFDRDGRWVATASHDYTARVWDASTGEPITPPLRHGLWVLDAEFAPDGGQLFTLEQGKGLWSWDLPRCDRPVPESGQLASVLSGQQIDPVLGARNARADELRHAWETLRTTLGGGPLPALLFRKTADAGPAGGKRSRPSAAWPALWEVDTRIEAAGLALCDGLDGTVEFTHHGGRLCAANPGEGRGRSFYLYFRAAPPPPGGPLYVSVDYYDQDLGPSLKVEYDGTDPAGGLFDGAYTLAETTVGGLRLGRGTWRRAIFCLRNPAFWGRQNLGADLRISVGFPAVPGTLWVRRVELSAVRPPDWDSLAGADLRDLSKAIAARPKDRPLLYSLRSGIHIQRVGYSAAPSEWRQVAADLAHLAALQPGDPQLGYRLALCRLAAGDTGGYRQTCRTLLAHFGPAEDPRTANSVAWACALGPGSAGDLRLAVRLGEKAVAGQPKSHAFLNTLGAVLYRAGHSGEAIRRLQEGVAADSGRAADSDCLFLAMAHQRLGRMAEARRWLAKAEVLIRAAGPPGSWELRLEQQLHRREAEALIRASDAHRAAPAAR